MQDTQKSRCHCTFSKKAAAAEEKEEEGRGGGRKDRYSYIHKTIIHIVCGARWYACFDDCRDYCFANAHPYTTKLSVGPNELFMNAVNWMNKRINEERLAVKGRGREEKGEKKRNRKINNDWPKAFPLRLVLQAAIASTHKRIQLSSSPLRLHVQYEFFKQKKRTSEMNEWMRALQSKKKERNGWPIDRAN